MSVPPPSPPSPSPTHSSPTTCLPIYPSLNRFRFSVLKLLLVAVTPRLSLRCSRSRRTDHYRIDSFLAPIVIGLTISDLFLTDFFLTGLGRH